jgi:hypothetical protein
LASVTVRFEIAHHEENVAFCFGCPALPGSLFRGHRHEADHELGRFYFQRRRASRLGRLEQHGR